MRSYEIKSFRGGIADFEDKGIAGSFKFGSALDIRKKVDSLSCQQALVEEPTAGTFTALALFIVPASDGNTYFFCKDGKIIKRTPAGVYSLVYTDTFEVAQGGIKGAGETYDNLGNTFLYWATDTRLNRKKLPGTGVEPWNDVNADAGWPKTDLTSSTWHTMKVVADTLTICNDKNLATVGFTGTYANNSLILPSDNSLKTLIEANMQSVRMAVAGGTKKSNAKRGSLFLWYLLDSGWNRKKDIPAKGINAIIESEFLLMQAGTNGGLYFSDFINMLPAISFPNGGQVNPDGVDVDEGLALFGVFGNGAGNTGVYGYGRKKKNGSFALNLEYPFACDEIGSVKLVGSDTLISYKNGANFGVKKVDSTTKAQADYQGLDLKAPVGLPTDPITWGMVKLITASLPTGCAIEFWYRINKNGAFVQAKTGDNALQFTAAANPNEQEAIFLIGAEGKIFEPEVKLIPSGNNGPEVYKIIPYFD